jgi:hypothetical protein
MRHRALIGALSGIILTGGAAFAALASVNFPTPSTSISTLTVKAPDSAAVVVSYTKRCTTISRVSVCPSGYDVRVVADYGGGFAQVSRRSRADLRDTVRFERPLCPQTLKVRAEVAAVAFNGAERSMTGTSLWQVIRCSPPTPAELLAQAAVADSFPDGSRRITTGDWAFKVNKPDRDVMLLELLRSAKTATDSAKHRRDYAVTDSAPDSVYVEQGTDTLRARVGFEYRMCWLGRNRYTGMVTILDGDPIACEPPRARMQSERSS